MNTRIPISTAALLACLLALPGAGCAQQEPAEDYEAAREKMLEYRGQAQPKKPLERVEEDGDGQLSQVFADVPRELLDSIVADAALARGIEPGAVTVISARRVDWPDGSLGCPVPGEVYTQAIVPGYHVQVSAAGKVMDYRADLAGRFFVCGPQRLRRPGPDQ